MSINQIAQNTIFVHPRYNQTRRINSKSMNYDGITDCLVTLQIFVRSEPNIVPDGQMSSIRLAQKIGSKI